MSGASVAARRRILAANWGRMAVPPGASDAWRLTLPPWSGADRDRTEGYGAQQPGRKYCPWVVLMAAGGRVGRPGATVGRAQARRAATRVVRPCRTPTFASASGPPGVLMSRRGPLSISGRLQNPCSVHPLVPSMLSGWQVWALPWRWSWLRAPRPAAAGRSRPNPPSRPLRRPPRAPGVPPLRRRRPRQRRPLRRAVRQIRAARHPPVAEPPAKPRFA